MKKAGKIAQAFGGRQVERGCPAWWRWGKEQASSIHPPESGSDSPFLRTFRAPSRAGGTSSPLSWLPGLDLCRGAL